MFLCSLPPGSWFRCRYTGAVGKLIAASWEAGFATVETNDGRMVWSPETEVIAIEAPAPAPADVPIAPVAPRPQESSRKEIVYRLFIDGEKVVAKLIAATASHAKGPVDEKMVGQWLKWWSRGERLPACAKKP